MDDKFFTSQFNATMYQMLYNLLEKYIDTYGSQSQDDSDSSTSTTLKTGPSAFDSLIEKASERYGVNADLIKAVVNAESSFDPQAISSAGAQGLMQLMPATANSLGVQNPLDPAQNIDGGTRLLKELLERYDGDVRLALAAYNAGPGAVDTYGGIPPYQETQTYVQRVLAYTSSDDGWSV